MAKSSGQKNAADFKALDRTLPFKGEEAIDTEVLECFSFDYANTLSGDTTIITTATEEFTSVCPFSGLPDFAMVTISYTPNALCLELRSLKYYLMSYRDVGIWYEHLANRMLLDLVRACKPQDMLITIECTPRGGLASTVRVHFDELDMGPAETFALPVKPKAKKGKSHDTRH